MRGLVIGKFMPPHTGHRHLIERAMHHCEVLDVVVCTLPGEPIPPSLRLGWMRALAPGANIIHLGESLPQEPAESTTFWAQWDAALHRVLTHLPTHVFASESYGGPLANLFTARFIPIDPDRGHFPTSATMIREDPMAHWAFIPRVVRPHYAKRVCIFGPESTGKSTLTVALARAFDTIAVPEHARTYLETLGGPPRFEDMFEIGRGQASIEDVLARDANRVIFCDTDVLTTTVWSDALFARVDPALAALARARASRYDLHLLLDVDLAWEPDDIRYFPEDRRAFFLRCEQALRDHGLRYEVVSGRGEERTARAIALVQATLGGGVPIACASSTDRPETG